MRNFMVLAAVAACAVASPAMAQITSGNHTVTDVSSPVPVPGTWGQLPGENTGGGSAHITSQNVSDTNGSLNITGDRSRVQTGIQYGGGTPTGISANSLLNLTGDYFVNALGTNASATPAFRVLIQDGAARSELIWEGSVQPDNQIGLGANSADAGDLFWQFVAGCGPTVTAGGCPVMALTLPTRSRTGAICSVQTLSSAGLASASAPARVQASARTSITSLLPSMAALLASTSPRPTLRRFLNRQRGP